MADIHKKAAAGKIFWFEPFHRPADAQVITVKFFTRFTQCVDPLIQGSYQELKRRMAATVALRDLEKRLKPDSEEKAFTELSRDSLCSPSAIQYLVPKISTCTKIERKILRQCLRLFPHSLQLKDIGAINSLTTKQKQIHVACIPDHLQCNLDDVQESVAEIFQHAARRQEELKSERKAMQELFIKKLCEIRLEEKKLMGQNLQNLLQATTHSQHREKEARQMALFHNRIGSELQQNRTFFAFWKHEDGIPIESFHRMQAKYSKRRLRANRWVDRTKREAQISDEAEAFAARKILEGKDLIFDDREFQEKLEKGDNQTRPGFSFRDEPDAVMLSDIHCSLSTIRQTYSRKYRENLENNMASKHSR